MPNMSGKIINLSEDHYNHAKGTLKTEYKPETFTQINVPKHEIKLLSKLITYKHNLQIESSD